MPGQDCSTRRSASWAPAWPVVTAVKVNSPAGEAGIRTGDKLVKVNQTQPASPEAARKAVDDAKKANGQAVLLQLERQGTKYFVGVPFSG